jgi:zinc protease
MQNAKNRPRLLENCQNGYTNQDLNMNSHRFLDVILAVSVVCFSAQSRAQRHPRELAEPPALSFKTPRPVEFTLANGIHVFYLEDRELPLISVRGMLRGGELYEPEDKAGLASLTGRVMRTGGTPTLPGDKLDEELEFLAASVETGMGDEYGTVSANCLKKDFARVLEIFADVVMHPEFPQAKIDLARNREKEVIRRRWDQPAAVSSLLFRERMLGETPYGRRATFKSLNNIKREDMVSFHQRFFAPGNLYLAVVGDLSENEARTMLEAVFREWKGKDVAIPELPPLTEKADGTVYYAFRDTPQANVVLGHLGVRRNNPDEQKIEVMNQVFGGGGFTARLMKEIRSNRGLTYGIYGGVYSGKDRGVFRVASQLKADRCGEALSVVRNIIQDLQTSAVSEQELDLAKKGLVNSFVFRFESKEQVAARFMELRLNGYPDDYLDQYIDNIRKVTAADVQEMAKKYIDLGKMILVVVGDEKKFDQPLSKSGKVQAIDYKQISEAERTE